MPVETQPMKKGQEMESAAACGPTIVRPSGLPAAIRVAMLATILASFPGPGRAHHAFTTHYNPRETTELRGVIVDFSIQSPHSFFLLESRNEDGTVEEWEVETHSAALMRRAGFDERKFATGDVITVFAWPNRTPGKPLVFGIGFIARDGSVLGELPDLEVYGPGGQATGAARLAGRWMRPLPKQASTPMSLTPAALEVIANYDPEESPANRCAPFSMPSMLYAPYLYDIQLSDQVAILHHEYFDVTRTVPLNSELAPAEPSGYFGSVSGRVEGDELVVESAQYPASTWGLAGAVNPTSGDADVPSSEQKKVIERYSVSQDGRTLTVTYVVEDPVYLTEPYSDSVELYRVADDTPMYRDECDFESASRFSQ